MSDRQEEQNVQEEQPIVTEDTNVDYKALYLDEVQNAKKLRMRAQDSELTIQDFTKNQETQKVRQLKEQEKFQELSESLQKQLDEVSPYKERWENHEASEKEEYLSKLPEEDREVLKGESNKTLKYIIDKIESSRPMNPQPAAGASRNVSSLPEGNVFENMDKSKLQGNWQEILSSYKSKNKK